jgi:hypothetical protein
MRNNKARAWLVLGILAAIAPLPTAHGASPASGVVGEASGVVGKTMISPQQEQAGPAAGIATGNLGPAAPQVPAVPEASTTQAELAATAEGSPSGVADNEAQPAVSEEVPDFAAGIIGR